MKNRDDYGNYWESWKSALVTGLVGIAVFAVGLVVYSIWLKSMMD